MNVSDLCYLCAGLLLITALSSLSESEDELRPAPHPGEAQASAG